MRLTRELDNETASRLRKAVFAGRLAHENELAFSYIDAAVKEEFDNHLLFHIQCLSPIPEELSQFFHYQNRIFRGSTRSPNNMQKIRTQLVHNFDRLSPEQQRKRLEDSLAGKVILFSLNSSGHYLYLDLIKIEQAEPLPGYRGIPGPKLAIHTRNNGATFEDKLLRGLPIVLAHHPSLLPDPEFIYYDRVLYGNLRLRMSGNSTTYCLQNAADVRCLDVSADFFEQVRIRYDDHMFIVSEESILQLRERFRSESYPLHEAVVRRRAAAEASARTEAAAAAQRALLSSAPAAVGEEDGAAAAAEPAAELTEAQFLRQLEDNARAKGLYFDRRDLVNFHISLKTNLLTIVGGMSGTGKSQLALLYGETLGLRYSKHLRLIPISPSYHEPNDVLGFMNPSTGLYQESETGLVRTLLEAERNPQQLYMIVFDEMNLAQVEHWFSPFISILELEREKRQLRLFDPNIRCLNGYNPEIAIGDNVLFVGTVNFDETTKAFSNRLLDRANVITPRKLSFGDVWRLQSQAQQGQAVSLSVPRERYRGEWTRRSRAIAALTEAEIELLDRVHQALEQEDRQQGISFRVVQAISHYLDNIPMNADGQPELSREAALDIQFKQRVLSKISGMESVISSLVGSYDGDDYTEGLLAKALRSAPHVSAFERSVGLLKKKAKELMVHGYAY